MKKHALDAAALLQPVHWEEFLPYLVYSNLNVTITVRIHVKHVSLCTTLKKNGSNSQLLLLFHATDGDKLRSVP